MSKNNLHTIELKTTDIKTVLCGLQWSINHHKTLSNTAFAYKSERQDIIDNHNRLKQLFNNKITEQSETSCPRSSETVKPALVAVNGDIHSYLEALKSIADQLALLNKCAFDNSILSDEEHYALLEIELQTQQLITGEQIICSEVA